MLALINSYKQTRFSLKVVTCMHIYLWIIKNVLVSTFPFSSYYNYLCRYMNPVTFGDCPETMRALVGNWLPTFTDLQSKMLRGSLDFLGLNYYTAGYTDDSMFSSGINLSYTTDSHVNETSKLKIHNLY